MYRQKKNRTKYLLLIMSQSLLNFNRTLEKIKRYPMKTSKEERYLFRDTNASK